MYIIRKHTKIRIYIYIYIYISFAFPRFLTTQTPSTKQVASTPKKEKKKKKRENREEALKQRDSLYVCFWINLPTIQTRGTVGRQL